MNTIENEILRRIQSIFPKWNAASPQFVPTRITEDDLKKLRAGLYYFRGEDLPRALGLVMVSLLQSHPPSLAEDPTFRTVLLYLDAGLDEAESEELREFMRSAFEAGSDASEMQAVTEGKQRLFSGAFNSVQAEAIKDWLQVVQDWPCAARNKYEIRSALKYWSTR